MSTQNLTTLEVNKLRHNARIVVRELGLLNDAYFDIGVTLAERHLLIELNTCVSPTMSEIAERLLLDKSTVSHLISKAVKKDYIKCTTDEKDKRKRFLHLTKKGKDLLDTFEPIAFNQTKEALLTLTAEEITTVYQGVALYAKGLKNSRLKNKSAIANACHKKNESFEELFEQLNQLGCTLAPFCPKDETGLHEIFQEVVDIGAYFIYECTSIQEFRHQFFNPQGKVYVCHSQEKEVIGGFYIKPNFPGRSSHIANAAYMIKSDRRGKGIGSLLVKASLHLAKELGFQAMQFNMVLSQNIQAVKLYEKLGFTIIGTLSQAVRNPDGSYQNGHVMHRNLDNL